MSFGDCAGPKRPGIPGTERRIRTWVQPRATERIDPSECTQMPFNASSKGCDPPKFPFRRDLRIPQGVTLRHRALAVVTRRVTAIKGGAMNRSLFLAAAPIPAWRKRLTRSLASAVLASMAMLATTQVSTALPAPRYALFDLGTLGGPQTYLNLPGFPITNQGFVLGTSDTTIPDTDYPNFNPFMIGFPDPYVAQAIEWQNGHLINLGALPGNNSSAVFQVNSNGVGTGMSETAINDPYTGWPADHAVIFMNGGVVDLGTLPGGFESQACCITDRGIVAGFASNGTADPVSIFGWGTQSRSFIWQNGVMHDIGTLGGPDAVMTTMNSRGQVDG